MPGGCLDNGQNSYGDEGLCNTTVGKREQSLLVVQSLVGDVDGGEVSAGGR